jgi:hypothetical protein
MSHWCGLEELRRLSESLWRFVSPCHLVEGLPLLELLSGIHDSPIPMIFAGPPCSIVMSFGPQCFDPSYSCSLSPRRSSAFCTIEQLSGGLFDGRTVTLIQAGALFFASAYVPSVTSPLREVAVR